VTERQGRRRKQLLDGIKETRGYIINKNGFVAYCEGAAFWNTLFKEINREG